jgi:3-hydroxy-9,10-secoandrosta-1,3,5(10)-triene-9,17-dione monooxygenase reductase component
MVHISRTAAAETVAPDRLRAAMGHFATGVAVVTAADAAGQPFGTTATAISSLSLRPPLVLACLRRESETLGAIRGSGRLAINLLAAGQRALAERFARPAAAATWDGVGHRLAGGVPLLDDTLATVQCALHDLADGGDHEIVIGRVVALRHVDAHVDPLVFYRGAFAPPAPAAAPAPRAVTAERPVVALPSGLGALQMLPLSDGGTVDASVAVLVGEPRGTTGAAVHVHRGCVLGDALGSQTCRGRERLHGLVARLQGERRPAVIVYHRDGALGLGPCCLGDRCHAAPTGAERAALAEAIELLELRDPVIAHGPALEAAA